MIKKSIFAKKKIKTNGVHDPGRGFGKLTRVDPIYHHHLNVKIKICHLEIF